MVRQPEIERVFHVENHPAEIISVEPSSPANEGSRQGFRSDIQALRALAVLLVLMYHAQLPGAHAGFLGVDVFFVISGFVITNVLLKERSNTGGTSLLDFYGRRIRRILPAATLVIIATIFATYHWLSYISGAQAANDAKWVAAFLGNFHFSSLGTDYLTATQPPSTLQQFWSLAVEEQFYLVWPALFIVATLVRSKIRLESFLIPMLAVIIGLSMWWSIHQTVTNAPVAFFSPFTRAWELALGALLAVVAPWMKSWPALIGHALRVVGLIGILAATWFLSSASEWPGANSLIPVLATGAMVAGGSILVDTGFDAVTNFKPIQWIGLISYSLYLVHWPILTIAKQYSFTTIPLHSNIELALLSVVVAALSYYVVERPIRNLRPLVRRRWLTYAMGAILIGSTYGVIYWHLHNFA